MQTRYHFSQQFLCYCFIYYQQGRPGAKTREGSTPDFESDEIDSPTKLLCISMPPFCLLVFFSVCLSFCLSTCLQLVLSTYFISFSPFPLSPSFFLELQSDAFYRSTLGWFTRPPWTPFLDAPDYQSYYSPKICHCSDGWLVHFLFLRVFK